MIGSQQKPQSGDPDALQISYLYNKYHLAGTLIGAIFYGIDPESFVHLLVFTLSVQYRDCDRFVLQMYERVTQLKKEGCQMDTRGSQCCHVLDCDNMHCGQP